MTKHQILLLNKAVRELHEKGHSFIGGIHCNSVARLLVEMEQEIKSLNKAAQPKWISVEERLPDVCDLVLVIASGQPKENIKLYDAILIASYWDEEGWIADGFDGWDKLNVTFWMELPEGPKEET